MSLVSFTMKDSGGRVMINPSLLVAVIRQEDGSTLVMSGGTEIEVWENLDETERAGAGVSA